MLKKTKLDLTTLNQDLITYMHTGYDLYFVHGWITGYLSSPSDSDQDMLLPFYLIMDEDKLVDEKKFSNLVDELVEVYREIGDSIYVHNKLIQPLVDFQKPHIFDTDGLSREHKRNLLCWLYGYMACFLAISNDIAEYASDLELVEERYNPAVFTLCLMLFNLAKSVDISFMGEAAREDFADLQQDMQEMWESEEGEMAVTDLFAEASQEVQLSDVVPALNSIFYVVRKCDEDKHAESETGAQTLLGKLSAKP